MKHVGLLLLSLTILTSSVFAGDGSNWVQKLTDEEYQSLLKYIPPADVVIPPADSALKDREFPEVFDWRELDGLTPVRNQGQCGSCWAFSALGVVEAQAKIEGLVDFDLSEQQLVDCTPGSYGCGGGNYELAWDYMQYRALTSEDVYPYAAENQDCQDRNLPNHIKVTRWEYINDSVESIKAALMDFGPVATVMGANDNLKMYTGGCYQDDSNTGVNHGVVIVGWDDTICEGGSWIVRNSWGASFGLDGYFYIHRGDVHIGENPAIAYVEITPALSLTIGETLVQDGNDGKPSKNELFNLSMELENVGRDDFPETQGILRTSNPEVTIPGDTISIESIEAGTKIITVSSFQIQFNDVKPMEDIEFFLELYQEDTRLQTLNLHLFAGKWFIIYNNDFEGETDEGWTHGYTKRRDNWMRGIQKTDFYPGYDPGFAHSGDYVWGNELGNGGGYVKDTANYLNSPVIDCSRMPRVYLSFWRWLSIEKGEYDHARVLINDEELWSNPIETHLIDTRWVYCLYDITAFAEKNPMIQVTFELESDSGLNFGGWNIDDILLFSPIDTPFEETFTSDAEIELTMSKEKFISGDNFVLKHEINNYYNNCDALEYVILDVGNMYWFWPGWTGTVDYKEISLPEGTRLEETLLEFQWPEIEGSAENIRFWGALVNQADGNLLHYDFISWGW